MRFSIKLIYFLINLAFVTFDCFSQESEVKKGVVKVQTNQDSKTNSQSNTSIKFNFGTVDEREITISDQYAIVVPASLKLLELPRRFSKNYFNSLDDTENLFKVTTNKKVVYQRTMGNKVYVTTPPLKPNRFYKVELEHSTRYNLFSLFKAIQEEGLDAKDKYNEDKDWMDIVRVINERTSYKMLFIPSISELEHYKEKLRGFNLTQPISEEKKKSIKKLSLETFEVLHFRKEYEDERFVKLAKWADGLQTITSEQCGDFLGHFKIPDYLRIYNFFLKYVKGNVRDFNELDYVGELIKSSVGKEKNYYVHTPKANPAPNFIGPPTVFLEGIFMNLSEKSKIVFLPITTYEFNYENNYKRSLVPDFGYIWNLPTIENGLNGGQLYLGVNISITPVNKNVPLSLSNLTLGQRLSVHTGITLNSLLEDNFRDDFFGSNSLLIGLGYKALTQSTRFSVGGLFFRKLDPLNGSKSLAVHPYLGISIDIEIKKWLESTIPGLGSKIK